MTSPITTLGDATVTLNDCINDYLNHLRHEQGAALTTFKGYQSWLHNLQRWMSENGYSAPELDAFNTSVLRRYLYHLSGRGPRPRTIRGAFHAVRGLGRFLTDAGALKENPTRPLTMPKLDAAQRLTVTDEELSAVLAACDRIADARRSAMAKAILSAFVFAGLRRQECLDLRLADVNFTEKSLLVRSGKGSKSRKIFVCAEAVETLREWIAVRPDPCKTDYLFAFDRARRISCAGLQTLIEEVKAIAGYRDAPHILPHSIRHRAATRLLQNGANLKDIQTFLGHSSLQVTSVYLHSNEEQAKSLADLTALRPQPGTRPDNVIDLRARQSSVQNHQRRRIPR